MMRTVLTALGVIIGVGSFFLFVLSFLLFDFSSRSIGDSSRALAIASAAERGARRLTLSTFRDVAWNGPYYAALGFEELPVSALSPELLAVQTQEADLGLDVSKRMFMSCAVETVDGHV